MQNAIRHSCTTVEGEFIFTGVMHVMYSGEYTDDIYTY